jgi:hypothetical protein
MNYSRILKDGTARDEALKRRNGAVREALGMEPRPGAEQPAEQKMEEEKPSEPKAP